MLVKDGFWCLYRLGGGDMERSLGIRYQIIICGNDYATSAQDVRTLINEIKHVQREHATPCRKALTFP